MKGSVTLLSEVEVARQRWHVGHAIVHDAFVHVSMRVGVGGTFRPSTPVDCDVTMTAPAFIVSTISRISASAAPGTSTPLSGGRRAARLRERVARGRWFAPRAELCAKAAQHLRGPINDSDIGAHTERDCCPMRA